MKNLLNLWSDFIFAMEENDRPLTIKEEKSK